MDQSNTLAFGQGADSLEIWRPARAMLAYALLLVLLLNFIVSGGHDDQRVLQLSFLVVGAVTLAFRSGTASLLARLGPGIIWPLALFFGWGMLSAALSLAPRYAWYEISSLFLIVLISLEIARDIARNPASLHWLLKLFGVVAAVYGYKIIAVYVSVWMIDPHPETIVFTPGFTNVRHFNHVQTVVLPLLGLFHVLNAGRPRWRAVAMGASIIWWTLLFVTGGRGTILGLLAGTCVVLVLRRRDALLLLRSMATAALIGALGYLVFFWMLPQLMGLPPFGEASAIVGRTLEDPINGRRLLWARALELIRQHPWFGVGPLHFVHYGLFHGDAAHPHNWMLQIASEWGLPALAMLCTALAFTARGLWSATKQIPAGDAQQQTFLAAWMLTGTAIVADGMVSGNMVMPQSQLAIMLYIGLAVGWTFSLTPPPLAASKGASTWVRAAAIVTAIVLAGSVGTDFIDKATNETVSATSAAGKYGYWWTRLWLDTHF